MKSVINVRSKLALSTALASVASLLAACIITAVAFASPATLAASGAKDPTDANITRLTADLLEHSQFSHHRLDAELAAKFLNRYLDSLDPSHSLFFQSDVQTFDLFRPFLPTMTRREGDLTPERDIFKCYVERLGQRAAYVTNLLHDEKFDFTGRETYQFDRADAPRPADLDAARQLWREALRAEYLEEKLAGKKPADIVAILSGRYTRILQTTKKLRPDEILAIYLNALSHVYDPHSDYMGSEQMDDFSMAMNLSLYGIGATLRADDGYCRVNDLIPGGPAARSGLLKPGDRIVAVGQGKGKLVDIVEMPLTDAVKLIRGPKGSSVRLSLIPASAEDESARKIVTLVRDEVKLEDERARAQIIDLPQKGAEPLRLGVINLPSFYRSSDDAPGHAAPSSATADVAKLVRKLETEGVHGIVLDLRRNGGGSLREAITLTGLFVGEGPVVQTRELDGHTDVDQDIGASKLYDGPLIVLTSRFSASASEILAGALQDYGRAIIVGDKTTFGKGTVQTVIPLGAVMDENHISHSIDPGALKVTIQKFYRPSGASTQLRGVEADIVLPSLSGVADVGEAKLKDPLPWDSIGSSDFTRDDRVTPYLRELRLRSAARVADDKDFAYLRDDIADLKKTLAEKSDDLNEGDRRHEQAAVKSKEQSRKDERAARKEIQPTTYDITVQNASAAGLPAAVAPIVAAASPTISTFEDPGESKTPVADPDLREAERILADYATMRDHPTSVAVGRLNY